MSLSEYKYNGLKHSEPIPQTKRYCRQNFNRETREILDDIDIDIIYLSLYNTGDIDSLYEDLGPAFWCEPSDDNLREWGVID